MNDTCVSSTRCDMFMTSSQLNYFYSTSSLDTLTPDQIDIFSNLTDSQSMCDVLVGDEYVINMQCDESGELHFLIDDQLLYTHYSSISSDVPKTFDLNASSSIVYVFCSTEECVLEKLTFCNRSDVFTIIGDDHLFSKKYWDPELYGSVVSNIEKTCPLFHVSMGDLFLFNKECKDDVTFECCDNYAKEGRRYLPKNIPFFSLIGNWEDTTLTEPDSNLTLSILSRHLVKPSRNKCGNDLCTYYTFVKRDTRFVVLDSETYSKYQNANNWDQTLGDDQYYWLVDVLNESTSSFHMIFVHRLLGRSGASFHYYEWGGRDHRKDKKYKFHKRRPDYISPIHDLVSSTSNPIVFVGHDHVYNREIKDGVVYLSVPQALNPVPHRRELFPCTSFYHITPGHSEVEFGYDSFAVTYMYFNKTIIDFFIVSLNGTISFDDSEDCMN